MPTRDGVVTHDKRDSRPSHDGYRSSGRSDSPGLLVRARELFGKKDKKKGRSKRHKEIVLHQALTGPKTIRSVGKDYEESQPALARALRMSLRDERRRQEMVSRVKSTKNDDDSVIELGDSDEDVVEEVSKPTSSTGGALPASSNVPQEQPISSFGRTGGYNRTKNNERRQELRDDSRYSPVPRRRDDPRNDRPRLRSRERTDRDRNNRSDRSYHMISDKSSSYHSKNSSNYYDKSSSYSRRDDHSMESSSRSPSPPRRGGRATGSRSPSPPRRGGRATGYHTYSKGVQFSSRRR